MNFYIESAKQCLADFMIELPKFGNFDSKGFEIEERIHQISLGDYFEELLKQEVELLGGWFLSSRSIRSALRLWKREEKKDRAYESTLQFGRNQSGFVDDF